MAIGMPMENIKPILKSVMGQWNYTLEAYGEKYANIFGHVLIPTGYTPVGVLGYKNTTTNLQVVTIVAENNDYSMYIKNLVNAQITGTLYFYVLCVKNEYMVE